MTPGIPYMLMFFADLFHNVVDVFHFIQVGLIKLVTNVVVFFG